MSILSPRSRREWERDLCRNLRSLQQPTWGFTIFRTVYTLELDTQFPSPSPFMACSTEPPFDSGPNEEMKRRYKNDVVDDHDRGVDLEIHALYARHRVCIMVDTAVLNSVAAGPEDPSQGDKLEPIWVKVAEYLAPGEEEWQGWLKVGLTALNYFWLMFVQVERSWICFWKRWKTGWGTFLAD
ncbi:uncharacterized protein BP5553_04606 [Venustampulla echinocandica]|uniref:Uncharacterized protein n=1 Tax=Venustampulla echinocandica TaxID=2656787 RepID=A0A370TNT0_9HELO|nr:uncharacterized protein BP5553_04606 [Venustampulla echinocandica]RDL37173.1 hypothetical protein BP5553_04606 [Venustampulla echinocandica]